MAVYKTVPNQKVIKVNKAECNNACKENYYARINLQVMERAAQALDAGAFKLWVYFAKNQNGYEFALSSKDVEATFGMKIKQYNNAVDTLIEKGYLVRQGDSAHYTFNESGVITKGNNVEIKEDVIPKGNNDVKPKGNNVVIPKGNNVLIPLDIRNITNTTTDTTDNITDGFNSLAIGFASAKTIKAQANQKEEEEEYLKVSRQWLEENGVEYELLVGDLGQVVATGRRIHVI